MQQAELQCYEGPLSRPAPGDKTASTQGVPGSGGDVGPGRGLRKLQPPGLTQGAHAYDSAGRSTGYGPRLRQHGASPHGTCDPNHRINYSVTLW